MKRRAFVCSLAVCFGSLGFPCYPNAQQPAMPRRIGVLLVGFSPDNSNVQQFRHALRDAGYSEGRDVVIEWRSAEGDFSRIPTLVADVVKSKVDVIVVESTAAPSTWTAS